MHLPEGILPISHAVGWTVVAAPVVLWSLVGLRKELTEASPHRRALLGFGGALLFALTLFPLPLPPLGFSIHLCVAPLLAILLGLRPVVALTTISLVAQIFFAAHGGFTTLGANILTLGILGPAAAVFLFRSVPERFRGLSTVGVACAAGSLTVYAADVGILALAFSLSATSEGYMPILLTGLAALILPLVIAEGVLSAGLYRMIHRRIGHLQPPPPKKRRRSGAPVAVGAAISLFAVALLMPSPVSTHENAHQAHEHQYAHDYAHDHQHDHDHPPHGHHHHGLEGFDHVIFEGAAERAGVVVKGVRIFGSDFLESLFFLSIFACGCLAGWSWRRLHEEAS